jgi:hypothetical protein
MFPDFHRPVLAAVLLISLSACATCREHPAACAIVGAIVVGSIAATIENNRHDQQSARSIMRTPGPQICPPSGC